MDELDLARHLRAVGDSPEDPDLWLGLARDLRRADRLTPELLPELLEPFLVAWRSAPEARELERFFQVLTGLVPTRYEAPRPPWLEEPWVEVEGPHGAPYHRELGLPMAASRLEDRRTLWLWPGCPAQLLGPPGDPALPTPSLVLRTGYVAQELAPYVELTFEDPRLDLEGFDRYVAGMGEGVPAVPTPGDRPLPMSRLLGRRLAHGLTPEDQAPLPPPPRPVEPVMVPMPRMSGAPPPPNIRLGGAPVAPRLDQTAPRPVEPDPPRRGLVQRIKDLFDR